MSSSTGACGFGPCAVAAGLTSPGKTLGLDRLLVGLVTLALNSVATTVALARGYVTVGQMFTWGVRFWFVGFIIAGAWAAIATFISSCFKSPILSLLTTFASFFVLWLVDIGGLVERMRDESGVAQQMSWYEYFYPNAYDTLLLAQETTKVLTALGDPGHVHRRDDRGRRLVPLPAQGHLMSTDKSAGGASFQQGQERWRGRCSSGEPRLPGRRRSHERESKERPRRPPVRLRRLTKRFGAKTAVDEVSLTVDMGSVYGLIGPNGAGKTTTFSMMAGYLHPTEGSVEILGHAPTAVDDLRSRVGVLPQDALLPAYDKVGEFLVHMARLQDFPAEKATEMARNALEEVSGKDWWNQRCGSLSHGMAKARRAGAGVHGTAGGGAARRTDGGARSARGLGNPSAHPRQEGRLHDHHFQSQSAGARGDLRRVGDLGPRAGHRQRVDGGAHGSERGSAHQAGAGEQARDAAGSGAGASAARELPMVKTLEFDDEQCEIIVFFERKQVDAETVIGAVLWVLLQNQARISGVSKGRGLEQRVMDLT